MKITFIGSGNIAHFFAGKLHQKGYDITQIYSRTRLHGRELAKLTGASLTDRLEDISQDADAYVLAIKDDALDDVAALLKFEGKVVIHCAGAVPLEAIRNTSENIAVIWALYSVRKNDLPRIDDVPLVVEANNDIALQTVLKIAGDISPRVLQADFHQRQLLHLNAVLVNNFTNHLFAVAEKICREHSLPFDFLHPIIFQTVEQIRYSSPLKSQTGPAIRHDEDTIKKHLQLLAGQAAIQKMYQAITNSIQVGSPETSAI